MHNIERRLHATTQRRDARYRGWDASGRFWYIAKVGKSWSATIRDYDPADPVSTIRGATLREISAKLERHYKRSSV